MPRWMKSQASCITNIASATTLRPRTGMQNSGKSQIVAQQQDYKVYAREGYAHPRYQAIRNQNYSQWVGRHELIERDREVDPDLHCWDCCASVCEEQCDDL